MNQIHPNEAFLLKLDEEGLLELEIDTITKGAPYVAALKEQLARLNIPEL
jgi:hypothetical protein